jgi:hypothetical protein
MKKVMIALALFTAIASTEATAQKAKSALAAKAQKTSNPVKMAGTYSTDLGEDGIVFTTSNNNPTTLDFSISEVPFTMIFDEALTKQAKGKLVFRHTTMDAYYTIEVAPGVAVHVFSAGGLKFDGSAMIQYVLVKDRANLIKYKSSDIKKSLGI